MSKEDYSLKEFEDWLRNKTIMVCAFKEPINPFEITSTYIEEFKESKETPRFAVQNSTHQDGDIIKYDVYLEDENKNIGQIVAIFWGTDNIDAEREAYYYAEYLNNKD